MAQAKEPATMRFERRMRTVPWNQASSSKLWGTASLKMAAGIHTITIETVNKSTFALMGHSAP